LTGRTTIEFWLSKQSNKKEKHKYSFSKETFKDNFNVVFGEN